MRRSRFGLCFLAALVMTGALAMQPSAAERSAAPAAPVAKDGMVTGSVPAATDRESGSAKKPARNVAGGIRDAEAELADRALLRRMIGQMLMIGFEGTEPDDAGTKRILKQIADGRIGGVLLLGWNVKSPKQLTRLTSALRAAGGPVVPLIAVDQEGGAVERLTPRKGFAGLPSAAWMAANKDPIEAYGLYSRTARQLASYGINMNFGPVVDLNVNPRNPIIGALGRSYGRSAAEIAPYARAFINAHAEAGVLTAAKHFPGHGSSSTDPHDTTADINGSWSKGELEPFKTLIREGRVPMIMVGHLILDGYSDGQAPASLSRKAVTKQLRGALGFDGVIVTDDLDMDAVRSHYRLGEAFVRAARAGNDLIIDANFREPRADLADIAIEAIAKAVEDGQIPRAQIEASYRRILMMKAALAEISVARKP